MGVAFFIFIRMNHGKIVQGFRNWLLQTSMPELKAMIQRGEVPALQPDWILKAAEYKDGIASISPKQWFELIAEASPELATYLNSLGYAGGQYLGKLRAHFLECMEHPESIQITAMPGGVVMVTVHCDKCDHRWQVPENAAAAVDKCPKCGAGAKD